MNQVSTVSPVSQAKALTDFISTHLPKSEGIIPLCVKTERIIANLRMTLSGTGGDYLAKCDKKSVIQAIVRCCQMGIEPMNPLTGHAYIVPFGGKKKVGDRWVDKQPSATLIIGYRGLVHLAKKYGGVHDVYANVVCKNDVFDVVYGSETSLTHRPEPFVDRGEIIGFYAVATTQYGKIFETMGKVEIDRVKADSVGKLKDWQMKDAPWVKYYEEMAKKTVIRRLMKRVTFEVTADDQRVNTALVSSELAGIDTPEVSLDPIDITPEPQQEKAEEDEILDLEV